MSDIRRNLSKRNPYWISKERRFELEHFCRQYEEWKKSMDAVKILPEKTSFTYTISKGDSFVERQAIKIAELSRRMDMVSESCVEANPEISNYIFKGVTKGLGYQVVNPPCCKEIYYESLYRFYYILDKKRQ